MNEKAVFKAKFGLIWMRSSEEAKKEQLIVTWMKSKINIDVRIPLTDHAATA